MTTIVQRKGGKSGQGKKGTKTKVVDKRMKSDSRGAKVSMRRAMKQNHGRLPKHLAAQAKTIKAKKKGHQSY